MKIALIGTGGMGKKYAVMLGNQLSAVVCRSEESKRWAADTLSSDVKRYDSAEEMYRNPDEYDAVLIVTPHKTHPELAIKAFELGKHVFCDKPAGVSVLQAHQMNDAAEKSGKIYAMMFHQRLYKKYIRIKQMLDEQYLGEIKRVMLVNSRYYRTMHYHKSGKWRSSWEGEGGGALINQGQHILDIWQWLFGMPDSLYANIPFGKYNDFMVDDEVTLVMSYPNKMSAVLMLTTGEAIHEERIEIVGTRGSILMEDDTLTIIRYSEDSMEYGKTATVNSRDHLTYTRTVELFDKMEEPYGQMFENFFAAVQGNETLIAPGKDGLEVLKITNAAYLSAWENKPVKLPIEEIDYELQLQAHINKEKSMAD